MKKIIYGIVFVLIALFFFGDDTETEPKELIGTSTDPNQTWAIYWYLCGSDLESDGGAASADLEEVMNVDLPENVKVIIQTGGAKKWENENVRSNKIQRFLYSSKGLELIETKPIANMGSANTLADFLNFSTTNYPADKQMVIFWNHGGGTVAGAAFDERYNDDSLTLDEFYKAFNKVYKNEKEKPFEAIGFDTCLMASIDTAAAFADFGNFLIASEDLEPGGGWNYTGFLSELAKDPGMDGARLGQHISDTYMEDCGWFFEDDATLSVVDLNNLDPLLEAYELLGAEALTNALNDPYFFTEFSLSAENTENYGGNTREEGYTNMLDLGDLVRNSSDLLPETSQRVLDALEDCVLYQVKGAYKENSSGLSAYYSYNGDPEDFYNYLTQGYSDSFKYLYGYGLIGDIPCEGMQYIESLGFRDKKLPKVPNIKDNGLDDYPVTLTDDGFVKLKLKKDILKLIRTVYFNLSYYDEKNNRIISLGQDNDMIGDMNKGEFKDNFRGVWGSIDGHFVNMEIVYEDDKFTAYSVPILLNGEDYNLRVIYDFKTEKFKILGARKSITDKGKADKNMVILKPGDKITPLFYSINLDGNDEITEIKGETFKYTKKSTFKEKKLKDGKYMMMFELVDYKNNSEMSQLIEFKLKGENMDLSIIE